jgi:hypothetical protein
MSWRSISLWAAYSISFCLVPVLALGGERNGVGLLSQSGDAYVRQAGSRWLFGTSKVEMELVLKDGHLYLTSFKNLAAHRDYVQGLSEAFRFGLNGHAVQGDSKEWILDKVRTESLAQGELLLTLAVRDDTVKVSLNYLIYPSESVIQEWLAIKNISGQEVVLEDPFFLQMHVLQKEVSQLDFSYMTGGMCFWGSWILKTFALTRAYARNFASTDTPECLPEQACPKGGSIGNSIYAPIYVFFNRNTKDGVFVGWDYLGRWASYVGNYNGEPLNVGLKVAGYKKSMAPGASVDTPKVFTGVFEGDLDEMGNQLKDYQYRYKWDYTRDAYFPATRMLGYWWNGASDFDPKHPGADVEPISTFRQILRVADLMRYVGGDIYWRDYGWWDIAGNWNGPDFAEGGRYLAKYGIHQTIYTIVYDAEQGSRVATQHPDWLIDKGGGRFAGQYVLDQSMPGVIDFELNLLENQVRKWGDYEWRKDDAPLHEVNGDATPLLAQDQNFRKLMHNFLDRNPGSAFHGCNGGGNDLGYDALRMAVVWQMSDGCVGRYRDYYASYLFPPDKLETQPDNWNPDKIEPTGAWRGLLWMSPAMTGDTQNPAKLEAVRQLFDIYHYLAKEGVVGRWVKVYHPAVTGDSPEWYLERLSSDNLRGIIIPSHSPTTPSTIDKGHDDFSLGELNNPPANGPVTIYPKGLLPRTTYNVSYQESRTTANRLGSELMSHGITLQNAEQGELIYLNLSLHPGSDLDKTPPSSPQQVSMRIATNMGYAGVELTWLPARDNNWVSYYEIFRNGAVIDKVAKGTYYFDHSLGSNLAARYEVRAVDGGSNASEMALAAGSRISGVLIVDDANKDLKYTGNGWKHEEHIWQVNKGTQSRTRQAADAVEYDFEGNRITWYGSLGESMGKADVFIDRKYDRTVDCFDADEIPNVAIYARTFRANGQHTIKVVARGDHQWRASDNWVVVDGFKLGTGNAAAVEDTPGRGIVYGGSGWQHGEGWEPAEEKSVSWTGQPGDSAEYKFRGDGITWVGKLCPACGMAAVYIDGILDTAVDTYEPDFHIFRPDLQGGWQAPVYEKTWTSPGEHTIRIVVRTERDMMSRGHELYLDAFQVTGQQ